MKHRKSGTFRIKGGILDQYEYLVGVDQSDDDSQTVVVVCHMLEGSLEIIGVYQGEMAEFIIRVCSDWEAQQTYNEQDLTSEERDLYKGWVDEILSINIDHAKKLARWRRDNEKFAEGFDQQGKPKVP